MAAVTFSSGTVTPMPDTRERPDIDGWYLTQHARQRMRERQVSRADVEACLLRPEVTSPDPKGENANVRQLRHGAYVAIADIQQRVVFTVNMNGMDNQSWREIEDQAIAVAQEQALAAAAPRKGTKAPPPRARDLTTTRHPLDGVADNVRATIEATLAGHWNEYVIRVLSPTQVTYWRKDQ